MKEQAAEIIEKSRTITIATVDSDGSPRSTILLCWMEDDGVITWHSSANTTHSQNIARDGKVGIATYYEDSEIGEFRAVYIATTARDEGPVSSEDGTNDNDIHRYCAELGEYDEAQSKPHRLYFKESQL